MKRVSLVLGMTGLLTGAAVAQPGRQPDQYRALLECRSRADDAARLRCLDAAVAALEAFAIPRFLRGGGNNAERDEIKELKTTVKAARDSGFMRYSLDLAEGGAWQTTDVHNGAPPPRAGTAVTVKRTPFGGYLIDIPGQKLLRARRTN